MNHLKHRLPLQLATRRGVLQASVATTLSGLMGHSVSRVFVGEDAAGAATNEKSIVLLWLEGGPFQHDSFDPKDESNDTTKFKYKPRETSADGLRFSESLPLLCEQAHHIAVIRSMIGNEMEHNLAQYHAQTGWRNTGPISAPAMGSIVAHEMGMTPMTRANPDGLPPFVSIGRKGYSSGHFGPAYLPTVVWDPNQLPENLGLPKGVDKTTFDQRLAMLNAIESGKSQSRTRKFFDGGRANAVKFMRSSKLAAFDLSQEPEAVRAAYGDSRFGRGCLLARRLVESGVRFIQVGSESYDQHSGHHPRQDELFKRLDRGMSQLIKELDERGLLENTLILAVGEFGRTPHMNPSDGRDHWIDCYSAALAGGGVKGGISYGATTKFSGEVSDNPVTIPDLMSTVFTAVGIDPHKEYNDQFNRPIKLVDEGNPVEDILA